MMLVNYRLGKINIYIGSFQSRVKSAKNKALYRTAGLIKTASKRSMRMRQGPSRPETPPHAHTRGGLRVIEFYVGNDFAIVGPVRFAGSNFFDQPVPHVHEFGGTFSTTRGFSTYPERSFMGSTLNKLKSAGSIPRQFKVSVGREFS